MYSAIMTGLGNYLRNHWGKYKESEDFIRVNYGATDSFWNKFNQDRLEAPGLIYASSSIRPERGTTSKMSSIKINSNTSKTVNTEIKSTPIAVDITLGMIGIDEEQHFWHIDKYLEMSIRHAEFKYPVIIEGLEEQFEWVSSISNFSELSPPPSGKEFSTYDVEGQLYPLEATFTIHTNIILASDKKLIRAIYTNMETQETVTSSTASADTEGMIQVSRNINIKERKTWESMTKTKV